MSNLEWIGVLVIIIVIIAVLIATGLVVMGWAHGFVPNKDPNHNPHLPKKDEIPREDWTE